MNMTVRELMEKLEECNNPDAIVTIPNEDVFINGEYEVTEIYFNDDVVLIDSDHENLVEGYE